MVTLPTQARLREDQNIAFDKLYINAREFAAIKAHIDENVSKRDEIHLADCGGGNGRFCDLLLSNFPSSIVYNVDLSQELLDRNEPHPRKKIISGSFLDHRFHQKLDVIFFNYVLHHLVSSSVEKTRFLIGSALHQASEILAEDGRLIIFENIIVGFWDDRLSSSLLYEVTSSRALAWLTSCLGANTAGVGVYYMGSDELIGFAGEQGFKLETSFCYRQPQQGLRVWPFLAKQRLRQCFIFSH